MLKILILLLFISCNTVAQTPKGFFIRNSVMKYWDGVNDSISASLSFTGDVSNVGTVTTIGALKVTNGMLAGSIASSKLVGTDITTVGTLTAGTWNSTIIGAAYGGTGVDNSTGGTANQFWARPNGATGAASYRAIVAADIPTLNQSTTGSAATLTTPRTINGISFNGSANITVPSDIAAGTSGNLMISNGTVWTSAVRYPIQVATADIAATANATSTTTLFTPTADGMYRVSIYLKITTTGTSPVAGPVTITYTDADGSVAQSHVMLLQNTSGAVVTTTVNNSTTTGTVLGSMVVNAKSGVAIQYAIAVSGTFGSGRYTAHLVCERLK